MHARPWNPDWATHRIADSAVAAGTKLDIKRLRHYNASIDRRNTAARLGHSGGGATTLWHYTYQVPEVDWRSAAYLS